VLSIAASTKTILGRCAIGLAVAAWISFIELYIYFDYTRPHTRNASIGRIFALNNHGSISYLTQGEHRLLYAFAYTAGAFVIVAAVLQNFVNVRRDSP